MEIVQLRALDPLGWSRPAVTVGNFDGVHLGHRALVAAAVAEAGAEQGTVAALTFDPHPSRVLSPDRAPESLMTVAQKAEVLAELGVERLVVLPFTWELSRRSPAEFVGLVLYRALGARVVVVGTNFRFGHDRQGDLGVLRALGAEMGFRVRGVEPVAHEGAPISSTRIREALARGAVEAARALLGRRFFVDGTIVAGAGRGRSLGVPTANLAPDNETLPGGGVYAGWCRLLEASPAPPRPAVVNVGRRPTFGGGGTVVEAHLLDFEEDLYGRRMRVEFQARLREERRFSGPAELTRQIQRDLREARGLLDRP